MTSNEAIPQKRTADFIFSELTRSMCPECKQLIDGQIHLKDGKVLIRKRCLGHGWFEVLKARRPG